MRQTLWVRVNYQWPSQPMDRQARLEKGCFGSYVACQYVITYLSNQQGEFFQKFPIIIVAIVNASINESIDQSS
jgi:hypothetical protein